MLACLLLVSRLSVTETAPLLVFVCLQGDVDVAPAVDVTPPLVPQEGPPSGAWPAASVTVHVGNMQWMADAGVVLDEPVVTPLMQQLQDQGQTVRA